MQASDPFLHLTVRQGNVKLEPNCDEGRFQPQNNDDRRPQAPKGPAPTLENLMAKFGNGKNDKKQNNTKLAISVKSLMRGGR